MPRELNTQVLIVGGGTGGVAAALAAADMGMDVVLTEETDWLGGQLTSQAVPPDENGSLKNNKGGGTRRYHEYRARVRDYYRRNHPLTDAAKNDPKLNPGGGGVSPICHEFRIGVAAIDEMLAPHRTTGRVRVLTRYKPVSADVDGDRVRAVTLKNLSDNSTVTASAPYVLDATELGELLPLTKTEYVSGAESVKEHNELHATESPQPENVQSLTWCFAMAYDPAPGANHVIDKPNQYARWRDYEPHLTPKWPGKMLSWTYSQPKTREPITRVLFPHEAAKGQGNFFNYRQIIRKDIYHEGYVPHEATLVNWPQNDYWEHNIIDKPEEDVAVYLEEARELSMALFYWMQTEAPSPDGGTGYPGLYLRPDLVGTTDGLAMAPYIRESRRIRATFTVTENHVGAESRKAAGHAKAERFADSVGIGSYAMDLHPSTSGANYIDRPSFPFQIPLGALIPVRMENLLPACKNLGVTHITNGCYRLHPVEWNIGEAAGALAAFCVAKEVKPREVREKAELLAEFQGLLTGQGFELAWPGAKS
jgi:hypothetical protein